MCQVHTGAYVSLLAPGKTDCTACQPKKDYHVYICTYYLSLPICTTYASQLEKRNKEKKEDIGKERTDEKAEKRKRKRKKEKTRKARKDKTRRGCKERRYGRLSEYIYFLGRLAECGEINSYED